MIDLNKAMMYGLEYFGLYYGTYRGQVMNNADPNNSGCVQVHCPSIHGTDYPQTWAWPVASMGGKGFGLWHVPDVGEWVHVRFDHGRLEYPMWEGGWWAYGDATSDMTPTNVVLATKEGLKIVLNRQAKTVLIQQATGTSILLAETAVTVDAQGDFDIIAQGNVNVTGTLVNLTGLVAITGNVTITGNLVVTGTTT